MAILPNKAKEGTAALKWPPFGPDWLTPGKENAQHAKSTVGMMAKCTRIWKRKGCRPLLPKLIKCEPMPR